MNCLCAHRQCLRWCGFPKSSTAFWRVIMSMISAWYNICLIVSYRSDYYFTQVWYSWWHQKRYVLVTQNIILTDQQCWKITPFTHVLYNFEEGTYCTFYSTIFTSYSAYRDFSNLLKMINLFHLTFIYIQLCSFTYIQFWMQDFYS